MRGKQGSERGILKDHTRQPEAERSLVYANLVMDRDCDRHSLDEIAFSSRPRI